jgi:ribosome biogenesis GTPase A
MNQPCKGCGHPLQNTDPLELGYTPKEGAEYCQSCFRYKHYKDNSKIKRDIPKQTTLSTSGLVLWCVDSMFPQESFETIDRSWLENDFVMVLTKFDVYPTHLWHARLDQIKALCVRYDIHPLYMVPFSKLLPWTKDHILQAMKASPHHTFSCIGRVNAGKSSLINALINESSLLTSPYAHTTQAPVTLTFDEFTLIDHPGFDDQPHPFDTLDHHIIESIHVDGLIKPITYLLKRDCVIVIKDVAYIECHLEEPSSLTLFMSERSVSSKRNLSILESNPYDNATSYQGSCDIELTHVCWMHLVGPTCEITIHTHPNLKSKETRDVLCW